jgi:hypothetical protein
VPAEEAHRDAFWVITVVGGMSVARVIEDSLNGLSIAHWTSENAVILSRFFVFLLTSVRFYIGASVFSSVFISNQGTKSSFRLEIT